MSGWPDAAVAASRLLEVVNAVARAPWAIGLRRPYRANAPVVSVGNIALGGTGKTPLVAALAETLLERGGRPAVLTRGYRRRDPRPLLVRSGEVVAWETIGDEPALLARTVPGITIVVDPDRVAGATRAVGEAGATHLLLDDGFQHWRLGRDLDIVVVDARDPLCLTRPRREHPRALGRADAVVVVLAAGTGSSDALADVARYAPRVRTLVVRVEARRVHRGGRREAAAALAGRRVLAAAGIASPERFAASLRGLGAEVTGEVQRPDHHAWRSEEIEALLHAAAAQRAELVMTGKDAVKLPAALAAEVAWLEVALTPVEGSFADLLAPLGTPDPH